MRKQFAVAESKCTTVMVDLSGALARANIAVLAFELDAVSVCTPNGLHLAPTIDALNAGCHVLVEKPLAMNATEGQKMLDAAKKNKKHLVIGFQHQHKVKQFVEDLRQRLSEYGLELNEEKTRLIRFGRFARQNREELGEGKPESFTFLGFRHVCAKNSQGRFEIRRITDGDRRRKKLQELKQELRRRMHDGVEPVGKWLKSVLNGYYQYHAIPGNLSVLKRFRQQVARYWFHALEQRSQRRPTWEKLGPIFDYWLPVPKIVHAFPDARFDARRGMASHPR